MTDNARTWLAFYLRPFRDTTLIAFARRCRTGTLDTVLNPLLDLAASADRLTGSNLTEYATHCCHAADVLYRDAHDGRMYAMEWLMEFDLARANNTEAAFVRAIAEVVEMELARRCEVGRN